MDNVIEIFEHEKFGKVRIVIINGRIHFVAVDVCRALEIKNVSQAVSNLDDDEKKAAMLSTGGICSTDTPAGEQNMLLVNEPGLYRLILSSRKKEALAFQRWVYHEVLPSINKTGSYSMVKKIKPAPNPNRRAGQLSDARVYVFQMNDGSIIIVKIGQSKNVDNRKAEVERDTKKTVTNMYYTPLLPRKVARLIEKACHEIFSSSKLGGEFFSVEYEEACKVIDAFVNVVACLQVSDVERGEKLLAIASMMTDSPERQIVLTNSAKLIAGRKFD